MLLPACLPARPPACLPACPTYPTERLPTRLPSPPRRPLPSPRLAPCPLPRIRFCNTITMSAGVHRPDCGLHARGAQEHLPCAAPSGRPQVTHALGGRRRLRQAGKRGLPAAGLLQRTSSCPAKPRAVCRSWLAPNTHYACFSCPAPEVTRCLPAPAGRSSASTSKSSLAPPGVALPSLFDKLV